jgi:hypothetical protein
MRKLRRYSIAIKDAKGSVVLATGAAWDGDDRRAAVAKILRLDGVVEVPCFPDHCQDVASTLNVERMSASFATTALAKKKPRH